MRERGWELIRQPLQFSKGRGRQSSGSCGQDLQGCSWIYSRASGETAMHLKRKHNRYFKPSRINNGVLNEQNTSQAYPN